MFTDMAGYTALGQRNESLSLALVEKQRKMVRPILGRHCGREVKTIGDGFLVEFQSALEAVRCAYDIQRAVREFNITMPEERRVHLRVGIHLGDVIESHGDISGDAVNVASRIVPLSEVDGVCMTRQVYDQVRNKFELDLRSVGIKSLKNVSEPVEVYEMVMPWEEEPSAPPARLDKRRIAVLPFANMSQDPSDEYFADGLTEELIGTLSKIRDLSVISRTSVMQYKGKPKQVSEIGRELNAGTILEGSVRKSGNRARVGIQMVDATQDRHVWAESYDRDLQDIFLVQSDIAQKVAEALKVELLAEEKKGINEAPTNKPEANLLYLKGIHTGDKGAPSDLLMAIEYLELAVEQDPRFALAYADVAAYYVGVAGEAMPSAEAFARAGENLARALSLNPKLAEAHAVKGWIAFQYDWDWGEAESSLKEAIELNPSHAEAHDWYGRTLASLARFDESISEMSRAYELDPASPWIMSRFGLVNWMAGKNREAREMFNKALEANPRFARARLGLAFVDAIEGRKEDAISGADAAVAIGGEAFFHAMRAVVHAWVGSEKAREILENILAGRYRGYAAPGWIAHIYYVLGDRDKGYEWARRSHDERDPTIPWTNQWPISARARGDPRFVEMLRQMGLP
jgi:adenylate cyclase